MHLTLVRTQVSPCLITLIRVSKNCDDQNPQNQARVYRLTSILRPRKSFLILLNCAKLKFVSYTSQLTGTNVVHPKIHKTPPYVDFESQSRQQSLSLGTDPIYNDVPCFPHDNSVRNRFV